MNLLVVIIFGTIIGLISHIIDPQPSSGGALGAIILGVLGAFAGGFLGNIIFGVDLLGINFASFAIGMIGAAGLLFLSRAILPKY
ncbi:GlsB/YeaQ/YmgE family stress response membrane protein [Candidatus Daviesbacteria bacterium]|nr:GlsB/YeaQ/YmgE family stress response membrane protein [Candidatus Daviesbacteria bacterium]